MEKVKNEIGHAKKTIKDFFANFFRVLRRPEMVVLPGNLAFFFVLAIIPSLGLISYAASILNLSIDFLYNFIAKSFNSDLAGLVLGLNINNSMGISLILTLIFGLYIASNGADALIIASNTIYGIKNKTELISQSFSTSIIPEKKSVNDNKSNNMFEIKYVKKNVY